MTVHPNGAFIISGWSEPTIRLVCFGCVLLIMAAWELAAPRSTHRPRRAVRWSFNLGLMVLNTLLIKICMPITAVATTQLNWVQEHGLLRQLSAPYWIEFLLTLVLLDFLIYLQHLAFHALPFLWQFHQVHHSDVSLDVTTGVRFHTMEILLSSLLKIGAVIILGPTAISIIAFEILLNGAAMFNHSHVHLPVRLERTLRRVIVTPQMHAIHHSSLPEQSNSNFGFNLSCWDYLFQTLIPPETGFKNNHKDPGDHF